MNETALLILRAFDRLGRAPLREADLLAAASDSDSAEARATLEELVASGALRREAEAGRYERTEFGRLEVASLREWTLLTRAGCHLCDEALRQLEPLAARLGAQLRLVDVDQDAVLKQDYSLDVPVLFVGSQEIARHRINPAGIRAALRDARK